MKIHVSNSDWRDLGLTDKQFMPWALRSLEQIIYQENNSLDVRVLWTNGKNSRLVTQLFRQSHSRLRIAVNAKEVGTPSMMWATSLLTFAEAVIVDLQTREIIFRGSQILVTPGQRMPWVDAVVTR